MVGLPGMVVLYMYIHTVKLNWSNFVLTFVIFFTGYLSASQWASAIESVLRLDVPWHMLKHQIAHVLPDGRVDYMSSLSEYTIEGVQEKVR